MKRYRLISFDFDSRANILNLEIKEDWEDKVKKQWLESKESIKESLIQYFGVDRKELKLDNFKKLGPAPVSIVSFHNKFFKQIRDSFVIGAYYPALTGVCALGERMLNYLILTLKDDFKLTKEYKEVHGKKSFDNWGRTINILESWKVLLPEVASKFKELEAIRNKEAIHFNLETESKDKERALKAIKLMSEIISGQFPFWGLQPWFIEKTKGEFYIKKSWEKDPFVAKIYLPNCRLVGPFHRIDYTNGVSTLMDRYKYDGKEIGDAEFVRLREEFIAKGKGGQ